MRKTLRQGLTALMLSSVALVPAATVSVIVTADAAYAKSDNSKGGGKGGGKSEASGKMTSKGKSGEATASRGGNDKSSNRGLKGLGQDLRGMGREIKGLFDGEKRGKKPAKPAKAASASKKSETPEGEEQLFARGKSGKVSAFHPSELGNMNGAMNANINAVLAHIRNGNTNGPVGAMALLATAKATASEAGAYGDLYNALRAGGYESLADYEEAIAAEGYEPTPEDEAIADALAEVESDANAALDDVAKAAGFTDALDYYTQRDAALADPEAPEFETIAQLDDAEGQPFELDEAALDEAGSKVVSLEEAEANILDMWNKNPGDVEVEEGDLTPQDKLLEELHARLDGYSTEIADAMGDDATGGTDGDAVTDSDEDCTEGEACLVEEVAAAQ